MIERHRYTGRDEWLAIRSGFGDVTASVVGGLRGLHPYTSRFKLYLQAIGHKAAVQENVRMKRGSLLEDAIGKRVAQDRPQWRIEKADFYVRDPEARLGATPDFILHGDPRGIGIMQTKLSIAGVFEREWMNELGEIAPPAWIMLQALTEAMLCDAAFGVVACYIDHPFRDDIYIVEFDRHPGAEAQIRKDTEQFWHEVDWRIEPDIDPALDGDMVRLLYPEVDPFETIDLRGHNYLTDALAERVRLKKQIKDAEGRVEEIDTELRHAMGTAKAARLNGFTVKRSIFDVDAQMRQAYRVDKLTVTDTRPKEERQGNGEQTGY